MKVAVVGLWHLGLVTAACLAKAGHDVVGYDPDQTIIANLQQNISPIFEPGLDDLIKAEKNAARLSFSHDANVLQTAEIVWVNFDTPVDENDQADVQFVINTFKNISLHVRDDALVLFSSQLPVGTTRQIKETFAKTFPEKKPRFGYIPENLRLGKAIQVFTEADRFVVGLENSEDQAIIKQLLGTFTERFVWMSIESAEMTKHAINAFLAVSVTFINEIATLCENVGANASEVEAGLKSEERIGPKAYLRAGGAIAGGTLLRDIHYLNEIGKKQNHPAPLLSAILHSNAHHKNWVQRKLTEVLTHVKHKTIAVLGLTYKPNTNTLRRSSSIETCKWLHDQGAKINAYDPAIQALPSDYANFITLKNNIEDTLHEADALVIATEWADFKNLALEHFLSRANNPIVLDPNGFLASIFANDARVRYCSPGRIS